MAKNGHLRIGFIGYGTAARQVAAGLRNGQAGEARLVAALVRRPPPEPLDDILVTTDRERFLAEPLDLVVELAGQEAVRQHGEAVLRAGKDLLVISIGSLADDALFDGLRQAAVASGRRLLLPSGAIGALDAISSAAVGGLDEVTLTTRKPPDALQTGTERDGALAGALTEPVLLYEGTAREAVRLYLEELDEIVRTTGVDYHRVNLRENYDDVLARFLLGRTPKRGGR